MLFFLIVIFVFALMYGYIGWRIIVPAAFSLPVNIILWGLLVTCVVLPFFTHIARYFDFKGDWVNVFAWVGFLSFGFLTVLFSLLLTRDLILLITLGTQKLYTVISNLVVSASSAAETADPVRRRFLMNSINAGLVIAAGGLTGYGVFEALRRPKIINIDLPLKGLPKDLDGFTIAQITDIHVSHTLRRPFVQTVVDMVNELKPDLIALTGDLVDGNVDEFEDDVAPLTELKAPHGLFFITGNHEYYSGVEQWLKETRRLGFDVLINEHRLIERGEGRLLLAGVTDFTGGSFRKDHISDPHRALEGAPASHARILLAHQPKSIFEAAKAGYDYVISGHTHGGQYFPYHFLAALAQPYIAGLHEHGSTRIYVSKGTGYWGPQLRIGARSEITLHRLVSA